MSFRRLNGGHLLALVAALALLLAMAPDWYTDKTGEQDRFFQHEVLPQLNSGPGPTLSERGAVMAQAHEKNAWQAPAAIDRVILVGLLASAALAIAAAFMRAAGRGAGPPSPSALATLTGLFTALLLAYRIVQPPGLSQAAVVKWGAPLGLVCLGVLTIGSRIASLRERERPPAIAGERAAGEPAEPPPPPPAPVAG